MFPSMNESLMNVLVFSLRVEKLLLNASDFFFAAECFDGKKISHLMVIRYGESKKEIFRFIIHNKSYKGEKLFVC